MGKTKNEVWLIGHAGKDAELKYIPSGKALVKFSLATGGGKKKDGSPYPTEWHNVVVWENEDCGSIGKGDLVEVRGRIQTRSWDDKKTGEKKYMTEIVATIVNFDGATPAKHVSDEAVAAGTEITDEDCPF